METFERRHLKPNCARWGPMTIINVEVQVAHRPKQDVRLQVYIYRLGGLNRLLFTPRGLNYTHEPTPNANGCA
jgi:hypothetical protein